MRERDEDVIRRELGLDQGEPITYLDHGWDSRVYLVEDGEAVFKFARSESVVAQYEHEISVLRLLETLELPVSTPRVRWEADDRSYFGYEGIVGVDLSRRLDDLDAAEQRRVGVVVGRFLRRLHDQELDGVPTMTIQDEIDTYREKYGLAAPALDTAFTKDERRLLDRFVLTQLPDALRRLGGEHRLGHGDLGPWNVVLAGEGEVGLIDFGDVTYQDPSRDFAAPFGDNALTDAALDAYGADDLLLQKVEVRRTAFPVMDLPYYLGMNDDAGVQGCLELVRETLVGPLAASPDGEPWTPLA
jgi:aminoglycoside phosphotransferase (APT) family kinase protein